MFPVDPPLHNTFVAVNVRTGKVAGGLIVNVAFAVQLLASVTVTVYVPAATPLIVLVFPPTTALDEFLQTYVNGAVPPVVVELPDPFVPQVPLVWIVVIANTEGSVIDADFTS